MWTNRPPIQRPCGLQSSSAPAAAATHTAAHTPAPSAAPPAAVTTGTASPTTNTNTPLQIQIHAHAAANGMHKSNEVLTPTAHLPGTPIHYSRASSGYSSPGPSALAPHSPLRDDGNGPATLVDLVRRLSWDQASHGDMLPVDIYDTDSSMHIDVSMDVLPSHVLTTQPPSPVLQAMFEPTSTDSLNVVVQQQPPPFHHPHHQHRKAASCPFQLGELSGSFRLTSSPGGSPPPEKRELSLNDHRPTVATSTGTGTHTPISSPPSHSGRSSPSGKLGHTPSTHSSLFHPYSRGGMHMGINTAAAAATSVNEPPPAASPTSAAAAAAASAHHRPTVISPASRFLSRKLATLPAALVSLAQAAAKPSNSPQAQPSHSPAPFPPPLSLSTMIDSGTSVNTLHTPTHPHHHPSASIGLYGYGGGSSPCGSEATPPASPHPTKALQQQLPHYPPTSTTPAASPPQPHTTSHLSTSLPPFRTPTSSPSSRPFVPRSFVGGGSSAHPASPAFLPNSPLMDSAASTSTASSTIHHLPSPSYQSHRHTSSEGVMLTHGYHSSVGGYADSSCSSPSSSSPLIRPDFSAFSGQGAWMRLSAHSPAKHRSLPGTPLHRAHQAYSVPPTPNARLAKQARSRRSSAGETGGRSALDAPMILIDYSLPPSSGLMNHPIPNTSFVETILDQTDLGSGSFGDVYRVRLTSRPFAQITMPTHANTQTTLQVPTWSTSAPPSPFLLPANTASMQPPPRVTLHADATSTATTAPVSPSAASIASTSTAAIAAPQHVYAYKRTRVAFASLNERARMLRKYTALHELIGHLRTAATTPGSEHDPLLSSQFLDPHTYFPRHLVHHTHVWQDNAKLHVLMELCSRGDITTYWTGFAQEELDELQRQSSGAMPSHTLAIGAGGVLSAASGTGSLSTGATNSPDRSFQLDDDTMSAASPTSPAPESSDEEEESDHHDDGDAPRPPLSPMSERILWRLLLEICSALALMHREGCLHLDVKPANIFVTESEVFKLGDVDSCVLLRRSSSQVGVGWPGASPMQILPSSGTASPVPSASPSPSPSTPIHVHGAIPFSQELDVLEEGDGLWCAPELLQSMQNASDKCDIYSLGASIHAVLNDEILQRDEFTGERHLNFQNLKCPISLDLHDTLLQMTHATPTLRPTASELMQIAHAMLQRDTQPELKLHWHRGSSTIHA